ncbi:hypothetical protein VKT23_015577 [Stygiomarasmius scandens]|uniref:Meiotically up-regulated protein Msb1/Mug8 domain-containing protein n=1 Tax=Marasmiellus scandens TaxID=2682957 RepID=A0ABR1IXC0_9AGAR
MPSIFSRSRTTSHLAPDSTLPTDEFGRVKSDDKERSRTLSTNAPLYRPTSAQSISPSSPTQAPIHPTYTYLPTNLSLPITPSGNAITNLGPDYGYLSYARHVVLSLDHVVRLVDVCCEELANRGGLSTPFIFSNLAMDIRVGRVRRLIDCFLGTTGKWVPPDGSGSFMMSGGGLTTERDREEAERKWREEAKFAGMHEIGMCLRWGLARVVRILTYGPQTPDAPGESAGFSSGTELRGLIPWEHYTHWRDQEALLGYPPTHFATFLTSSPGINYSVSGMQSSMQPNPSNPSQPHTPLPKTLTHILLSLLSLLARLTAHSASSGHTPPTLSPLFGPLIFGLGPPSTGFHETYIAYLRSVGAMEHIILSFVRWQDSAGQTSNTESNAMLNGSRSATGTTLGVPTRLKEWIKGYPAMLQGNFAAQPTTAPLPPSSFNPYAPDRNSGLSNISAPLTSGTGAGGGRRPEPRKGARTVRLISVRRNVRQYERDLVHTAAKWGETTPLGGFNAQSSTDLNSPMFGAGTRGNGLAESKEWERVIPGLPKEYREAKEREAGGYGGWSLTTKPTKMPPRYSEPFRKRLALPPSAQPEVGAGAKSVYDMGFAGEGDGAVSRSLSTYSTSSSKTSGSDLFSLPPSTSSSPTSLSPPSLSSFKSLTDLRWGEFEMGGFGGLGSDKDSFKALEFDLGESARLERLNWGKRYDRSNTSSGSGSGFSTGSGTRSKRESVSWNDFSEGGFDRVLSPSRSASEGETANGSKAERTTTFDDTLAFNPILGDALKEWPKDRHELVRKLKKREKALPPFGWDTSPIVGSEEVIEEAFIDVFCDLVYGSGWGLGLEGMRVVWGTVPVTSESLTRAAYATPTKDKEGKKDKDKDKEDEDMMLDDRDCNWALVEYKSLPHSTSSRNSPGKLTVSTSNSAAHPIIKLNPHDPRTGVTLLLFEEFVPLEYREQLAALAPGGSSAFSLRKRLPSLFSPASKSKSSSKSGVSSAALSMSKKKKLASTGGRGKNGEWKAAPTLNGRPYVVGSVPRSPSYREVEFEGLLRNQGSTTKLSLSGPRGEDTLARVESPSTVDGHRERDAPTPTPGFPKRMERATTPTPGAPLAQSTMVGQGQHANFSGSGVREGGGSLDEQHSQESGAHSTLGSQNHSNTHPQHPTAGMATNTPSKKVQVPKFRLPVSPSGPRKTGRTPMEYSTVDFETRLTTGSDSTEEEGDEDDYGDPSDKEAYSGANVDEEAVARRRNERLKEMEKKRQERRERRESRGLEGQDAWVDILVGAQSRRMGGQDAERRKRAVDPEQASLEVAQVLSAVRARGPPIGSDDEEMRGDEDRRVLQAQDPYGRESEDLEDVDEIEMVPRRDHAVYDDDEDEEIYNGQASDKREEDDEEDEPEPEPIPQPRRLGYFDLHPERRPVSTASEDPRARIMEGYDEEDEDEGVAGVSSAPTPAPASSVRPLPTLPPKSTPSPSTSSSNSSTPSNGHAAATKAPAAPSKATSKTAALIEMYRERERSGAAVVPPPSKIPLRRESDLPTPPASSSSPEPVAPTPRRPMPETPSKPKSVEPEPEPVTLEPPTIMIDDMAGRSSPARYVHGAPLHNVMEEEEEE